MCILFLRSGLSPYFFRPGLHHFINHEERNNTHDVLEAKNVSKLYLLYQCRLGTSITRLTEFFPEVPSFLNTAKEIFTK